MEKTEVYIAAFKKLPKKVLFNITFKKQESTLKLLEEVVLKGNTLEIFSRGEIKNTGKSIKRIQTFILVTHIFKIELGNLFKNGEDFLFLLKAKFDILLDKFIDKSFALFINRLVKAGTKGKSIKKIKKFLRKEREKLKENFISQLGVDFSKVVEESEEVLLFSLDYFIIQGEIISKGTLFKPVENIDFNTLIGERDGILDFLISLNAYSLAGLYVKTNNTLLKSAIKSLFAEYIEKVIPFYSASKK